MCTDMAVWKFVVFQCLKTPFSQGLNLNHLQLLIYGMTVLKRILENNFHQCF